VRRHNLFRGRHQGLESHWDNMVAYCLCLLTTVTVDG
jgi:hypothetical protein